MLGMQEVSVTRARWRGHPEDLVDLADRHVGLGLVRGHDQVGRQQHLIEELTVFETHVKRIHPPEPFRLVFLDCFLSKFVPAARRAKPQCGQLMAQLSTPR